MNRNDVTEKIIGTKVAKGLKWEDIAAKVKQSKEWTTALCLGQMTASPEQAQQVHALLRAQLKAATAHPERIALLYGGSMNAANAASLLSQNDIDGGLIGGDSLKSADFLSIVAAASH